MNDEDNDHSHGRHEHGRHEHGRHEHGRHEHGRHEHDRHEHGHGHADDQGLAAIFRYLRHGPRMWRSEVNDAVIGLIEPKPKERLIDVGAGMGAGTVRAAARGAQVVAVEPTPFMRRVLGFRRLFQRERGNIEVVNGSAERLPVADGSVDGVWAVNTMHHWVDVDRGVAEIARVLRPGGRVVLVDEDFEDPRHPEYESFGGRHADDEDHHHGFTMVDAADVAAKLRSVGLVDVDAETRDLIGRPVIAVTARAAAGSAPRPR